jgi:outer membrane biosynthesis protein TonB
MLSTIGRAAIRRTGALKRTNHLPPRIWELQRNTLSEYRDPLAARLLFNRGFATATKTATKAANTNPKKPAQKATKKPAKQPAKKVAKKTVSKPKPKPKLKAPPKKTPVKKRVITDIQKERLEKTKKTAAVTALKKTALLSSSVAPPKQLPDSAYFLYSSDLGYKKGVSAVDHAKEKAAKYREISPAELEVNRIPAFLLTHSRFF